MTSQAKIDSNRRNSLKSTGPKTPEGRERSSMNSLKHGMRSKKMALRARIRMRLKIGCGNGPHAWIPRTTSANF